MGHGARGLLAHGDCWDYFPHDHARSRAYRWGEDGLLGICDRECRLCFALALWNGRDPILKERLFGLTNSEGNHGEDVKECYFYLDSTPTHSYMKALYKYPQAEFPYARLVEENRRRGREQPEFELEDTGIFENRAISTSMWNMPRHIENAQAGKLRLIGCPFQGEIERSWIPVSSTTGRSKTTNCMNLAKSVSVLFCERAYSGMLVVSILDALEDPPMSTSARSWQPPEDRLRASSARDEM